MKKRLLLFGSISISIMLIGCASRPITNLTTKFDKNLTKELYDKIGQNTITGNSFLRQNGGGIITCAGNFVYLIPKTPYSSEIVSLIYGNTESGYDPYYNIGVSIPNISPEYSSFIKQTVCDSQGNFVFNNIADGEYFLDTKVNWIVGNRIEGGKLMKRVNISGNKTERVILAY